MKIGDLVKAKEYAIPLWWDKQIGIIVEQREYSPALLVQWNSSEAEYCMEHQMEMINEDR
tara:strand:+ start:94 stop:273 length:180 start_codon:yes stop_codon:yes gene_type:complete